MQLRDYQRDANDKTHEALTTGSSTLVVLPTGMGKTICFAQLIKDRAHHGRVLIMAHRDELIRQAVNKIRRVTGEEPGVEMAAERVDEHEGEDVFDTMGEIATSERCQFVVTSVQTQNAMTKNGDRRMTRLDPKEFGTVIIDEAHHATASTYQRVVDYYRDINPDIKIIGYTATPDRTDETALGKVFDSCAYDMEIVEAINLGWLVPIEQTFVEVDELDFTKVRTTAGDLNQKDLASIMEYEDVLHEVALPTIEIADGRQTLVFAASVHQAKRLCEIFNRYNPRSARFIFQGTPKDERRLMYDDYQAGKFQFLVNCMIATEGFDCPGVEVIAMARPTKSRALYAQMAGRATRPAEACVEYLNGCTSSEERVAVIGSSAKSKMTIIDFVGNSGRHQLITTADILGGRYDDDVIAKAAELARQADGPVDMILLLPTALQMIEEERERQRRKDVRGKAKWRGQNVNPFKVFDLLPQRERNWNTGAPMTDRMRAVLRNAGVDGVDQLTRTEGSQLIGEIIARREKGLCSYKQCRFLGEKHGIDAKEMTFQRAGEIITAIKANGWKLPPEYRMD